MTAPDPFANRQVRLVRALQVATVVAAILSAVGLFAEPAAVAAVAVLIAAPMLRVTWLAQRWRRRGDPRFALTAVGLLLLVGSAPVLAAVL